MRSDDSPTGVTAEQRHLIASLFDGLPDDLQSRHAAILDLRREFQQQLAIRLAPALNAHIRSMPQSSLEDRQHVATWANGLLGELGLRVRSDRGLPAVIVGDTTGPSHTPRYRLVGRDDRGRIVRTNSTSGPLFELELVPVSARTEPFSRSAQSGRPATRDR